MKPLASFFCTKRRARSGKTETFITLRASAPQWLTDAVYSAHGDRMPCDWVYAECLAACEGIDSGDLTEDNADEHADGRVDVYTQERFAWAHEFCLSSLFDEESAGELMSADDSIADRLGKIQYVAIDFVARTMIVAAERSGYLRAG